MEPLLPLFTNDLLREVDQKLYDLLSTIPETDWQKPATTDGWSVKDVLSHLVDVILRRLSAGRDRYTPAKAVVLDRYQDLVNYVEDLADQWVGTFRRVSPQLVLSLFHDYQDALYKYFCSLNPYDPALGVAWANESVSCVWFDLAREYSEHWIHSEQIRQALDAEPLADKKHLQALSQIFVRCLPKAYQSLPVKENTVIQIHTTGTLNNDFVLIKESEEWSLYQGKADKSDITITVDCLQLCRMLAGLQQAELACTGDKSLLEPLLSARAYIC